MTTQSDLISDVHHSRVCGSDNTYCGHPWIEGIYNFGNNEVLVGHKHSPSDYSSLDNVRHAAVHLRAKSLFQRSFDGGETWSERHVLWDESAPEEERRAFVESRGPRPEIDLADPDSAIYFGRTMLGTVRDQEDADNVTFAIRSSDRGRTWEKHPTVIEPPPGKANVINSNHPSVRLPDGMYLTPLNTGPAQDVSIYASGDNGVTWDFLVRVAWDRSGLGLLAYPALILAPNGKLQLYMINCDGDWNCMLMSESEDGYSWSVPRPIIRLGASPWLSRPIGQQSAYQLKQRVYYRSGWPMVLRDGRIAFIFGRRKPPHGIGLIVSEDSGATWSNEIILRDGAPTSDISYPVATELDDGRIFTAYYYVTEVGGEFGGPRHIAGTHFRLG